MVGAEGQADGQLVVAASHRAGYHAEQPHRREQQRADREAADERGAQPLLAHCIDDQFLQRLLLGNRQLGVAGTQRSADLAVDRPRRSRCAHHQDKPLKRVPTPLSR